MDELVEVATPVRRLRPPLVRAALWLALAAVILALLSVAHGLRTDLLIRLHQPTFVVSMIGAIATGILAAIASFELGRPDGSLWWLSLPAPALAIWVSTIGYGCLTDWVSMGPDGVRMGEAFRCLATLLLTSVPLAITMLIMSRHAAALRPMAVSIAGGLAIGAIKSFSPSLIHDLVARTHVLIWALGTPAPIAWVAYSVGCTPFVWRP